MKNIPQPADSAACPGGIAASGGPAWDERERLAALERYAILDTPREPEFDDIARLAADIFEAPIAVVNLIAEGRQWVKAEVGIGADELPLDVSICAHAILQRGIFVVPDTTKDDRFAANPLVTGAPGLRFYAGALLETPEGLPLGTVCVLDVAPRPEGISARQRLTLEVLARQVMTQLELRRAIAMRDAEIARGQASEERLGLVVDSARDYAIFSMDPERRVTSWSAGAEAVFGQSADEMIGQSADALWTPEDRASGQPEREVETATRDGCANNERWHQRADGTRVFMNGSVHPLPRDEHGHERGFIKIARDETLQRTQADELARTREGLVASEARYRALFEAIDAGFCIIELKFDAAGRAVDYQFLEVNPAFESQTGLVSAAGKSMLELVPSHEQHWFDIYGRIALTGEPARFEERAAGLDRWYDVHAFRVGEPGAHHVAVLFNDISERRRAEERLRELNETLEARVREAIAERDQTWNNARDLFLVVGADGVVRAANPAWTVILGWRADEIIGHSYLDFVHPEDRAASNDALASAAQDKLPTFENRYRHKDGSFRTISWVAAPEGDLIYANGRDVTQDRAAAQALAEAEAQLRQAQKMETVGQLTGGIAHDFNNLLTAVIGSLDMMQRRMAKGEIDNIGRYTSAALTAANRAAALTHRLLAFSRRQPLAPKPVDANRLVSGMEDLLRRTMGEAIRLNIVTADGLWRTLCDAPQLESAILNLAINARDAMPQGGTLTIETGNTQLDGAFVANHEGVTPGQYICISVTDTGTGMAANVVEKAFEPFFTTKPIGQGTGLGLSMIYGFARQSEGYAKIYSEVGVGTTFKLYLPRFLGEGEVAEEAPAGLSDEHKSEQGEIVLVVEDEAAVRSLVVDVLEELGYRAIEASDGSSALKLLESNIRVDLLVTDVGLPGLNGRQLVDAAREHRPRLKVLFMTGYAENGALASGFLGPDMELITKPFAIEALATRIQAMIRD
jgi:PAS domain S-box-containing protein